VQALYDAAYIENMRKQLIYSQGPFVDPKPMSAGNQGGSILVPSYHDLPAVPTAISRVADITPVTFRDSSVVVTPDGYGNAAQLGWYVDLTAFTDMGRVATERIARNAAETVDYLGRSAAVGGEVVAFGGDATLRSNVSRASSTDEIAPVNFFNAMNFLAGEPKIPGPGNGTACIFRQAGYNDLILDAGVILLAQYGGRPEILLNGELGMEMGGTRLIVSDFAKVFHGAGASGAPSSQNLSAAANQGATSIGTSAAISSLAIGDVLVIGTIESTANGENRTIEAVRVVGATGTTTVSIVGRGPNGGLLYDHSSGEAVTDDRQVFTATFLSADAILKAYHTDVGLDGRLIPSERTGLLKQFQSYGWFWFGGFAVKAQNRIYRVEHAATQPVVGK
jgi:N4-gp56 family major capsid protein